MNKSLSDTEIRNYFNGKINIVLYSDINDVCTIDELLGKYERVVILFEIGKLNQGHYTCLIRCKPKGVRAYILFFDSYGLLPENQLNYIPYSFRQASDQGKGYLYDLLKRQPLKVHYNEYRLQKLQKGINTCGRFCILRCEYLNISEDDFATLMRSSEKFGISPDMLSVILTKDI